MRRFKSIVVISLIICGLLGFNQSSANDEYEYDNLYVVGNIKKDGTIDVHEYFTANFKVEKHGIIRNIPLNYSVDGNKFHIDISDIYVEGKNFTTSNSNGEIDIKIGDANKTLKGEQKYPISYTTYGLIRNFSGMGYSELYWNVVGNQFDTNINRVKVELILPEVYTGFTSGDFLIAADGISNRLEDFEGTLDWSRGDRILLTYDKVIPSGNGITISVKFPNNYFEFNHERQSGLMGETLSEWKSLSPVRFVVFMVIIGPGILLGTVCPPLFVAYFGFLFWLLWKLACKIRDAISSRSNSGIKEVKEVKIGDYPVIVQYNHPQEIDPSEAGLLDNRLALPKHFTCMIYQRALDGLLSIEWGGSESNKVILHKIKDIDSNTPEYEKNFFENMFDDDTKEITSHTELSKDFSLADLDKYGVNQGWFAYTIRKKITPFPIIVILLMLLIGISINIESGLITGISIFVMILVINFYVFDKLSPRRFNPITSKMPITDSGAKLISEVEGYKKFIKACDENQLKALLKEDPTYFNKTLPYAVAFGLETEFITKITPLLKEMQIKSCLYDGDITHFSSITLTIDTSSTYKPTYSDSGSYSSSDGFSSGSSFSSSSSSGSSGGGGGGGGGRSW